jgi:transcriptional regulator with XRE-family HTH domain
MNYKSRYHHSFGDWLFHTINGRSTKETDRIAAFGRECGISRSQLYRYFRGERSPSKQAMTRMAAVLGIKLKVKAQKRRRNYRKWDVLGILSNIIPT